MHTPLVCVLQSCFVSSVLAFCSSSLPHKPARRAPLLHSTHNIVTMHKPATLTELSTLTSNQCTLCFELRDVRVCHLDNRNATHLSSARTGAPMTYRKMCWDRQLCACKRLQSKHVSGLRMTYRKMCSARQLRMTYRKMCSCAPQTLEKCDPEILKSRDHISRDHISRDHISRDHISRDHVSRNHVPLL